MKNEFIRFILQNGALKFGEFTTKAGRASPYFFNAGLLSNGKALSELARFYAHSILKSGIVFDGLFGPAYKGIVLASAVAVALAKEGKNCGFTYNRKEIKDHGEGGVLVGAPLKGRVLIVDDVISAGLSVGESVQLIKNAGAEPAGVVIALDREEKGKMEMLATEEVLKNFCIPVVAVATLTDVLDYLAQEKEETPLLRIRQYLAQYGKGALVAHLKEGQ